jgi:hypothetical protein
VKICTIFIKGLLRYSRNNFIKNGENTGKKLLFE